MPEGVRMLKIVPIQQDTGHPALRIEGKVVGPWVKELSRACEILLAAGNPLSIDLSEVSFLDREGIALLRALQDQQVALRGTSPFVAEQLREPPCGT
jgi:anti-anti-sigma regulatory factor